MTLLFHGRDGSRKGEMNELVLLLGSFDQASVQIYWSVPKSFVRFMSFQNIISKKVS